MREKRINRAISYTIREKMLFDIMNLTVILSENKNQKEILQ